MKVTLKGSFTKQDLIQAFAEEVENYMDEEMTGSATIYLRFRDDEGKSIDWVDENKNSLEVTVTPQSFKETRIRNRGISILEGYQNEKTSTAVANELEVPLAQVETLYQQFNELQLPSSISIIPSEQLTTYMLLEREVNMEDEVNHEKLEWIGITIVDKLHVEKVYSVRDYCMKHKIGYQENIYKQEDLLLTKGEAERSGLRSFTQTTEPHGLTLVDGNFDFFYDANRLLKDNDLTLFKGSRAPDGYVIGQVNGLTPEQVKGQEAGYIVKRSIVRRDFIPVYHPATLYKMYGVRVLSEEEIEERKGTTLFTQHRTTPYFPKVYNVQDELKIAGYDEEGREFTEPSRPLYEKFGLLTGDDIQPGDAVVKTRYMKKFQGLLKEVGIDINKLYPDGMTQDYQLVYRATRIPKETIEAYRKYEETQEFIRELKRT